MTKRIAVALAVLLAASAAQAQKIRYDYDGENDFSAYRTFAWTDDERKTPSPLAAERIGESLEAGFAARGFELVQGGEADFLIDFNAALREELRVDEIWWGRGRRRGWVREIEVTTYPVGTLVVVVRDGDSREVVWRGTVSGAVSENRERMRKKVDKAVTKLLKKYPPPR